MSPTGQQETRSTSTPPARNQPSNSGPGSQKAGRQAKMPPGRTWLWFVLILLANYLLMRSSCRAQKRRSQCPIRCLRRRSGKRNVEAIYSRGKLITGRFKAPVTYPPAGEKSAAHAAKPKQRASAVRRRRGPAPKRRVPSRPPCPPS